jgi:putative tryptophan/tyrosine transport system substrate-binding protein
MTPLLRLTCCIATLVTVLLFLVDVRPLAIAADSGPILMVTSQETNPYKEVLTGFRQYFANRNGTTALLEEHSLQGDARKAEQIFKNAKARRVQLILTVGSLATQTALQEAEGIPTIASLILNADELKKSTNATGVVLDFPLETQLQWLRKIMPQSKSVGVLFNPRENRAKIDAATKVAQSLGLTLLTSEVETPQALPEALENLVRRAEILWGITDQTVLSPQTAEPILLFSFRNRIPFTGLSASWAKAGALYALDRDYKDIGMQCGEIAAKILQGTAANTIPPQPPRKVFYALNLKTAEHMKLTIPETLVEGAQQVFR